GTVWVTDFGLSKEEGAPALTAPGTIVGTRRYMAPERFQNLSDARSDVYSLGITLYELLTLRPAFAEEDPHRLIHRVLHEDPPRPRQLDPGIPRDLETIILKAMAKEPDDRYRTAAALAEDLQRWLANEPIRARPSRAWERAWKWSKRRPAAAGLLAVLGLTVTAGVPGLTALWLNAEANYEKSNWNGYVSSVRLAPRLWDEAQVQAMQKLLEALRPKGRDKDLRGFEWHYLWRLCHSGPRTFSGH